MKVKSVSILLYTIIVTLNATATCSFSAGQGPRRGCQTWPFVGRCKALTSDRLVSLGCRGCCCADTIAGRQSTSASLGWPSKALCVQPCTSRCTRSSQRLVIVQSSGGSQYPLKSVASRDRRCERIHISSIMAYLHFIIQDT